ncbi:MAG: T9SS type A sorting domain-containing protein [Bacteroidales bacterium]|nr:T9SS type A sorting domain-containing protein [Bacteroidales bacterium]
MKILLYLILFLPAFSVLKSQNTVTFSYDGSGNRTNRTISSLKSTKDDNSENQREYKDQLGDNDILIYPNPVLTEMKIDIPSLDEGIFASLIIVDQQGRVILKEDKAVSSNLLDLSGLPPGIYYLNITIQDKSVQWKIVKE